MTNNFEFKVPITLKTSNIYDIENRVKEIADITEWLDELVEWQPDSYSVQFLHHSRQQMNVWFLNERHALICALRWL